MRISRRNWMQAAGGAVLAGRQMAADDKRIVVAGREVEIQLVPLSAFTFRLSLLPVLEGKPAEVPADGSLAERSWAVPKAKVGAAQEQIVKLGGVQVKIAQDPLTFGIETASGVLVQQLKIDGESGVVSFATGSAPILGLGEGGPQFDRRGSTDRMRSGQGGYQLRTHGGRVPIPWLIGTSGWAMFFHQPFGTFDFTGAESSFHPTSPAAALPLDIFVVVSRDPRTIMAEYAGLTGHPELPPLWSLGYQQSHRTLAGREGILEEARTFREKKLPCDALIYLGTGFCPSGWNTNNGEFQFNQKVFPDPKAIFDQLHQEHFKVALHVVIKARQMHGTVRDACDPQQPIEEQPSCYWAEHRDIFSQGVDGWWPDEGDPLNIPSHLVRNRMYWEGPQLDRPNERPYALHRNGYAGMQRYASFLWSGDVYSTWETLRTHIPIAVNTGLTGIPYWGTDIGGFVPTKEFTAELYVRWFQFGTFCPLFRSHGRNWTLRLPWGWNTGDSGPMEINSYNGAALPDASELHNTQVEPICRKYLELRYRMLPYLYSAVRECTMTGLPVMRSLWLHYPDDPAAVARGDEYLWGRDILVAPVTEQGAASRRVYLPRGVWYDFWSNERHDGGREISRDVDLETMPLYIRAGSILPLGPVKQYTGEQVDTPLTLQIYPGADGSFLLYEDDGSSFNYRKGEWMGVEMTWNDRQRLLHLTLAKGSRILPPKRRDLVVKLGDAKRSVRFDGHPLEVRF
ncbi:MAG TPA: TIM-barrel domain-containing protein [Bryobacteraceae bacterium]|nr:TIM-barrel domain-containing protein [Bryobacteraceae bacterium]